MTFCIVSDCSWIIHINSNANCPYTYVARYVFFCQNQKTLRWDSLNGKRFYDFDLRANDFFLSSFLCTRLIWSFKWGFWVKSLKQKLHLWGFSPVWTYLCSFRLFKAVNSFPQVSQGSDHLFFPLKRTNSKRVMFPLTCSPGWTCIWGRTSCAVGTEPSVKWWWCSSGWQ